jgi:hypothetical protein
MRLASCLDFHDGLRAMIDRLGICTRKFGRGRVDGGKSHLARWRESGSGHRTVWPRSPRVPGANREIGGQVALCDVHSQTGERSSHGGGTVSPAKEHMWSFIG